MTNAQTTRHHQKSTKDIHDEQFNFFRNEFSLSFACSPLGQNSTITVNVTPDLIHGLQCLNNYFDNYYIA